VTGKRPRPVTAGFIMSECVSPERSRGPPAPDLPRRLPQQRSGYRGTWAGSKEGALHRCNRCLAIIAGGQSALQCNGWVGMGWGLPCGLMRRKRSARPPTRFRRGLGFACVAALRTITLAQDSPGASFRQEAPAPTTPTRHGHEKCRWFDQRQGLKILVIPVAA
jgi:hypothetical protein